MKEGEEVKHLNDLEGLNVITEIKENLQNEGTSKRRRVSTSRSSRTSQIISRSNRSTPSQVNSGASSNKVNACNKLQCGPCYICEKDPTNSIHWFHLKKMKKKDLIDLIQIEHEDIQDDSCICNACRTVYVNKLKDPTYTPTKTRLKSRPACFLSKFQLCDQISVTSTCEAPAPNDVFSTFLISKHFQDHASIGSTLDLCKTHYNMLYNSRTVSYCSACNSIIKVFHRRYFCSSVDLDMFSFQLNKILQGVELNADSVLCTTCYFCVHNLQKLHKKTLVDVVHCLESVDFNNLPEEEMIHKKALVESSLFLCNMFEKDRAVLAVDVHECYEGKLKTISKVHLSENCSQIQPRKVKWLLSGLSGYFGHLLEIEMPDATNHSYLRVYKHSNLRKALHESLFQLRVSKRKLEREKNKNSASNSQSSNTMNVDMFCTAKEFNYRLKMQAKKNQNHYKMYPLEVDSVNFFDVMKKHTDPLLWNMLNVITMNNMEETDLCEQFSSSEHVVLNHDNDFAKERFNRRVILMFFMQFVMNDHFNYPFQIIHAGIIKQLSNSIKLLEMFNQSGWCVGLKTYERFLGEVVSNKSKIPKSLCDNTFTVVTVDNIDSLSPYAAVTLSNQEKGGRSWHGTSVMAQQPMPDSEKLNGFENLKQPLNMSVIKTYGCGRCFYRCLAIVGKPDLVNCSRNVVGLPQDPESYELETSLSDMLRGAIAYFMSHNVEVFKSLPQVAQNLLLESRDGEFDDTFEERIAKDYNVSTFAGSLEITVAAFLLKTQIHVFQKSPCNMYKEIAVYPSKLYNCAPPIHLLYNHDSNGASGHFDVLIANDEMCERIDFLSNESTGSEFEVSKIFDRWALHNLKSDPPCANVTLSEAMIGGDSDAFDPPLENEGVEACSSKINGDTLRKPFRQLFTFRKEKSNYIPGKADFVQPLYKTFLRHQLCLEVFRPSVTEIMQSAVLSNKVLLYVLQRYTKITCNLADVLLPTMKCKFAIEKSISCEKSRCGYLSILDEKADSVATIKIVLHDLCNRFQISTHLNHLIVIGDMKTFEYIMKVKIELGSSMDWVIPYPGDWHILKNFQEVIMKIYWDAGLKDLAKKTHFNMNLSKLQTCGNFKKTHRFLMQSYEAIYMLQLKIFLSQRTSGTTECTLSNDEILSKVKNVLDTLIKVDFTEMTSFISAQKQLEDSVFPFLRRELDAFCSAMSKQFKTFAFWNKFLNEDMFAYIEFFISLRSRNWVGRLSAVKKMCSLFHAFDRYNYSRWLSVHLSHIFGLPDYVLKHFENGAFASSISGVSFSCVGFDEWHEMSINKHVKSVIVRNTPTDISSTVHTLEYVAEMINNYDMQVAHKYQREKTVVHRDLSPAVIIADHDNICAYFEKMNESEIFSSQNEHLFHAFTGQDVSAGVEKDMTEYGETGKNSFEAYVESRILKKTSVKHAVIRKHRLKTFSIKKNLRRRVSNLEKERKLITKCFKRTINVLSQGGSLGSQVMQYIETPRAICNESNAPVTGRKSVTYSYFEKRYEETYNIIVDILPGPTTNSCAILEGMNLIYKEPRGLKKFYDFAQHLMKEWIIPYFRAGFQEVRVLFDQNGTQGLSPKVIEQSRRDQNDENIFKLASEINDDTELPNLSGSKAWSTFLKNRQNKHHLCVYMFKTLLKLVQPKLVATSKVLIISGGFQRALGISDPITVYANSKGQAPYHFQCNHEESDTQIWLHVKDTNCRKILIRSVDRDIAMVGLPLMEQFQQKQVYIQYDSSKDGKYLHMNSLVKAVTDDDALSEINENLRCKIVQSLYICSGCDFVSYFKEKGKSTIFTILFQYASFVNTSCSNLALTSPHIDNNGLNAFYRLIGCVFFNANRVSLNDFDSPQELFNSFSRYSVNEQHAMFLDRIRKASWQGTYEHELLPTLEALEFHWKRSCWVSTVWERSLEAIFDYPLITQYGWAVDESGLISVVWDTVENMQKVRENVIFLTKGCGCKSEKNKCVTRRCKCFKNGRKCGPGCSCKFCENVLTSDSTENTETNLNTDTNDPSQVSTHIESQVDVNRPENEETMENVNVDYRSNEIEYTESDSDSDSEVASILSINSISDNVEEDNLFLHHLYEDNAAFPDYMDVDSSDNDM